MKILKRIQIKSNISTKPSNFKTKNGLIDGSKDRVLKNQKILRKVQADGKSVAEEILKQLGGPNRLKSMLGTRIFQVINKASSPDKKDGLYFDFKGNPKLKSVKVLYNKGTDTYDLEFLDKSFLSIKKIKDILVENIKDIFQKETKLYLSL